MIFRTEMTSGSFSRCRLQGTLAPQSGNVEWTQRGYQWQ